MKTKISAHVQSMLDDLKRSYDEFLHYEGEMEKLSKIKECDFPEFPVLDIWGGIKCVTDISVQRTYELDMMGEMAQRLEVSPSETTDAFFPIIENKKDKEILLNCLIELIDRKLKRATQNYESVMQDLKNENVNFDLKVMYDSKRHCVVTYNGKDNKE